MAVTALQLKLAVERGIIAPDQADRLIALATSEATGEAVAEREGAAGEINLIQILYWAGALVVLFALGWFLIDRWKSLHPGGVLAVASLYALGFAMASVFLTRLRMPAPAGIMALLAAGMAPIIAWSIESLLGVWPAPVARGDMFFADPVASVRWIPIELSAALAGLIAMRRVHVPLLALSVSVPFALALIHATPVVFAADLNVVLWGWVALVASSVLVTAAYVIDQRGGVSFRDHATAVYFTGMVFLVVAYMVLSDQTRAVPHSLPVMVAVLVGLSVALRRSVFLAFAAALFVGYLGFLASSVFPTATGFMVVMVLAGAVLIAASVMVQRRYPGLLRGWRTDSGPRPRLRGDTLAFGASIAATLVLLAIAVANGPGLHRARLARDAEITRLRANARNDGRGQPRPRAAPETATPRSP